MAQSIVRDYSQFGSQYVTPAASYQPYAAADVVSPAPAADQVVQGDHPDPVVDYYTPPVTTSEGAVYQPDAFTVLQQQLAGGPSASPDTSSSKPTRSGISLGNVRIDPAAYWAAHPDQAAYQARAEAQWQASNAPGPSGYYNPLNTFPLIPDQTTGEGSPTGSSPDPIPNGDQPLADINTLLDAFHNTFSAPDAAAIGPAPAPGVTVIPDTSSSSGDGGSSSLVIWLAVIGIAVTIGLHWWSEHHKKKG